MKLRAERCPCGCDKFIVQPLFGCQCSSLPKVEAEELARRWNAFEAETTIAQFPRYHQLGKPLSGRTNCCYSSCVEQATRASSIDTSRHPGDRVIAHLCDVHTEYARSIKDFPRFFRALKFPK